MYGLVRNKMRPHHALIIINKYAFGIMSVYICIYICPIPLIIMVMIMIHIYITTYDILPLIPTRFHITSLSFKLNIPLLPPLYLYMSLYQDGKTLKQRQSGASPLH